MLPAGLLLVEYLILSLLVDLPVDGAAGGVVGVVRLAAPVMLAAAGTGWLLARDGAAWQAELAMLPPWRPWPALGFQPLAFAATAALAWSLLGPDRPAVTTAGMLGLVACGALTAGLALASAVPARWLARRIAVQWAAPLLAMLLGALVWRAAHAVEGLWGLFSDATLQAVGALLQACSDRVTLDLGERVIGLGDFQVVVAPICSGVNGAGLVVMFLGTWIALARGRLRLGRALLLLPLGAAAALLANVLRIAGLVWLGGSGQEAIALGGFHSKVGWVAFLGLALAGVAIAERAAWLRKEIAPRVASGVPESAGAYLGPLLAALATALLTGTFTEGIPDPWYGARIAAALASLGAVHRALPRLRPDAAGAVVGAGIGALVCAVWLAWPGGDGAALSEGLARLPRVARAAWLAQRLVGSILVIPVIEELAFRGFLLPWLISPQFESVPPRAWTLSAVLLSSLAFGALHANWALGALAGVAFAAARCWRGRLADAVVAHAVANAGVAAAVLRWGRYDLWN